MCCLVIAACSTWLSAAPCWERRGLPNPHRLALPSAGARGGGSFHSAGTFCWDSSPGVQNHGGCKRALPRGPQPLPVLTKSTEFVE